MKLSVTFDTGSREASLIMSVANMGKFVDLLAGEPLSEGWYRYADESYLKQHGLKSSAPAVAESETLYTFGSGARLMYKGQGRWLIFGYAGDGGNTVWDAVDQLLALALRTVSNNHPQS